MNKKNLSFFFLQNKQKNIRREFDCTLIKKQQVFVIFDFSGDLYTY